MQSPPDSPVRRLTHAALLATIALTIFMAEAQLPAPIPIPGVKLGLPNIVIVFLLYRCGVWKAAGVSLVRLLLMLLIFGILLIF